MAHGPWVLGIVAVLAGLGCGGSEGAGPDAGGIDAADIDAPPDAFVDLSAPLYDDTAVLDVQITLPAADWQTLRTQTRSLYSIFGGGPDCYDGPFASPFTYFRGEVTIDGVAVADVGVRKKGFLGSLSVDKPSLKVKFDEYLDDRLYLSEKSLTLNNVVQDPAMVRTCLAYRAFRVSGVPAPRCNLARVTVNGEMLGAYVHVEGYDKSFLRRQFGNADGDLYEGTLSDFYDGFKATFEKETNEATGPLAIDVLVAALSVPDDQLEAALTPILDLDAFFRFWAIEVVTSHWDGYAGNQNNFFLYQDPVDGLVRFFPWGTDGAFQQVNQTPISVRTTGYLAARLYAVPALRARYLAELRRYLAEDWDASLLTELAEQLRVQLTSIAPSTDRDQAIDGLIGVIEGRRGAIEAELAGGDPVASTVMREPICTLPQGNIAGSFSTAWGTIGGDPFDPGTASLTGTYQGNPIVLGLQGSTAGIDGEGIATVQLVGQLGDDLFLLLSVQTQAARITPGTLTLDGMSADGIVATFRPSLGEFNLVGLLGGSLTFTAAATSTGAPVVGSIDAVIETF